MRGLHRIFFGVGIWVMLALVVVEVFGFLATDSSGNESWMIWHWQFGVAVAIVLVLFQALLIFHLVACSRDIRQVVLRHPDPNPLVDRIRPIRGAAFKWSFPAAMVAVATPILGAGVHTGVLPGGVHLLAAVAVFFLNGMGVYAGFRSIREMRDLVDDVEKATARIEV